MLKHQNFAKQELLHIIEGITFSTISQFFKKQSGNSNATPR